MIPIVDERIEAYAAAHSTPERPELAAVAHTTRSATELPQMMVGPLEGGLLAMLVHLLQPQVVLEIGTFTGYSSLAMAPALPPGGRIITCELDPHHASLARDHFAQSPYGDRIELKEGPALETVAGLEGPFDFVFIDANKDGYADYYEAVLPKLSERGAIAVDNVLWSGTVVSDDEQTAADPSVRAITSFNDKVRDDDRVECVMLTVRDGLTLIRPRR